MQDSFFSTIEAFNNENVNWEYTIFLYSMTFKTLYNASKINNCFCSFNVAYNERHKFYV